MGTVPIIHSYILEVLQSVILVVEIGEALYIENIATGETSPAITPYHNHHSL